MACVAGPVIPGWQLSWQQILLATATNVATTVRPGPPAQARQLVRPASTTEGIRWSERTGGVSMETDLGPRQAGRVGSSIWDLGW